MQIKNIILYKDAEHQRVLPFELGKVNIITGESKSGKTALINIVDYCLGSKECKIADGVIRDNVHWFAITIVFEDKEQYVIARLNPNVRGVNTITEIFLLKVNDEEIPNFTSLHNNSNISALKLFLTRKLGIAENLQISDNNSRPPLEVNFGHSRLYSFQPQTLIAQQDYLFYKQTEQFIPQAIKDSLPYFLGAIREDSLKIEQEIIQKKKELNRLIREKNEAEKVHAGGISIAFSLIEEAKQIGILDKALKPKKIKDALEILDSIKDWENQETNINIEGENSTLKKLVNERNEYKIELGRLEDIISATKTFLKNNFQYSNEVEQQKVRLESIELFSDSENSEYICSLCNSYLNVPIPSITAIQTSLSNLKKKFRRNN